jgi:hypothetical protein
MWRELEDEYFVQKLNHKAVREGLYGNEGVWLILK